MEVQISLFGNDREQKKVKAEGTDKTVLLRDIEVEVSKCTACRLHSTRTNTVPGEGNMDAALMFIGEGPGADEDAKGRPFVGAAGKLLDNIIAAMGMRRDEVFIGNVVKCRPPQNRVPERDEMDTCIPFLFRQIDLIQPRIVVLLGNTSYKAFFPEARDGITKARGVPIEKDNRVYLPTFHPAALLRDPSKKADVWSDMKKVMSLLRKDS